MDSTNIFIRSSTTSSRLVKHIIHTLLSSRYSHPSPLNTCSIIPLQSITSYTRRRHDTGRCKPGLWQLFTCFDTLDDPMNNGCSAKNKKKEEEEEIHCVTA